MFRIITRSTFVIFFIKSLIVCHINTQVALLQVIPEDNFEEMLAILLRNNKNYLMSTFLPLTKTEWNQLDLSVQNPPKLNIFKGRIVKFVKPIRKQFIY